MKLLRLTDNLVIVPAFIAALSLEPFYDHRTGAAGARIPYSFSLKATLIFGEVIPVGWFPLEWPEKLEQRPYTAEEEHQAAEVAEARARATYEVILQAMREAEAP